MEFEEISSYKGDSKWYTRNGHYYVVSRTKGPQHFILRCSSDKCPVRWTMKDEAAGAVRGEHNHPPTPWVPNRNSMFQALKTRASLETIGLNSIYEQEAARFPDAAPHLLWENVAPSMRKWRRSQQPAVPATLLDYALALSNHPRHSNMLLATVSEGDATAVILVAEGFSNFMRDCRTLLADGTFLTVPAGLPAVQLLTLHCVIQGHNFHPIIALMENRRRPLYEAVLRRIWVAAGSPTPQHIVSDFEPALQAALVSVSGLPVQGCIFHFTQALLRRARQAGIQAAYNSPGWELIKIYSCLALLPSTQIRMGLAEIRHIAADRGLPFNEEFNIYFERQWINSVGPDRFSVYRSEHQTSNVAESFHSSLRRALGPSPNIWRFTDVVAEKFSVSAIRLRALREDGNLPRRNRERHYIRSTIQRRNEAAFERGTITLREYLTSTSRLLDVGAGVLVDDGNIPDVGEEVEVAPEPDLLPRPPSQERITCGICVDNPPGLVLISCGHTICASCYENLGNTLCPFCRSVINTTNRIFI